MALYINADTNEQKIEIIRNYLKTLDPDASFYLRLGESDGDYTYTITRRNESEGWDRPLKLTDKVIEALRFAREKHEGQLRDDGQPYFKHILDVIDILIGTGDGWEDTLLAAALHDVIEDTDANYEELSAAFGEETAKTVELLTKTSGEVFDLYMDRIFDDDGLDMRSDKLGDIKTKPDVFPYYRLTARGIKLADRLANLRDLPYCGKQDKINRYLEDTRRCFLSRNIHPATMNKIRAEVTKIEKGMGINQ